MSILNTRHTQCHPCPVQYWARDIYPVMQDWQIPSRSLLSLNMLRKVPINCLYNYPVTDNVRSATKYFTPHLGTLSLNLLSSLSEREHSPRRVEQHSSILLLAASVACHLLPIRVLGFQVSSIAERFVAVAVYWITVKLQSPGRQVNWSKDQDGADDWS
ncbi:hypothetical protein QL285_038850 [Trifolium repens]|nr:hypothetical protein QL285_038850 [Trifolium repens]